MGYTAPPPYEDGQPEGYNGASTPSYEAYGDRYVFSDFVFPLRYSRSSFKIHSSGNRESIFDAIDSIDLSFAEYHLFLVPKQQLAVRKH